MNCPNCGVKLDNSDQKYCEYCGSELRNNDSDIVKDNSVFFNTTRSKRRCC